MNIWHDINPKRIQPSDFIATIEISKGSKKKYELDKEIRFDYIRPYPVFISSLSC